MRSVRISMKTARAALDALTGEFPGYAGRHWGEAAVALKAAMEPKRSVKLARARKEAKQEAKWRGSARLRAKLIEVSGGSCELCERKGCDPHHALGRKNAPESFENCLWVCRACHEAVTNPSDGGAYWFRRQAEVFEGRGCHKTAAELRRKALYAETKVAMRAELSRGEVRHV
jgi:hypothetical protein